jgi:DMSO/TMAO reductase YedYZ molybdopterin-dependent catalytic subunit
MHHEPPDISPTDDGSPIGRRVVLGLIAMGAAGIVGGSSVQDRLAKAIAPIQNADPTGLISLLPLGATFRYYSVTGSVPSRNAGNYRLDIRGLVGKPASYTLADLEKMPRPRSCVISSA